MGPNTTTHVISASAGEILGYLSTPEQADVAPKGWERLQQLGINHLYVPCITNQALRRA